jgi:hypothetical protein
MITIPRRAARRFRAACSKCVSGRPRGPAPPVVLRKDGGRVTLTAAFPEVTLELAVTTSGTTADEVLVVPMAALEAVEGSTDDPAEFALAEKLAGTIRWVESGVSRSAPVSFVLPGKQHDPLPRPPAKPVPARLLAALHEAARAASRENGRYALSRVQVRGTAGQVVATDGKVAVLFSGFNFPFPGDVLVPAIPLFGSPELRDEPEVRVGRTPQHLVVEAGSWTAWLAVAAGGKYPDVAGVVPRRPPTSVGLDPADAAQLLGRLPGLPGAELEHRPVTLDADGVLTARAGAEAMKLSRSPASGPAQRVVLDRRHLARLLALGCHGLGLTPGKAVVAEGDGVTVLVAPLDPAASPAARTHSPTPELERSDAMRPHEANGHATAGRHDPPADTPDPLAAAEDLRASLADAAAKAARLVAALKQSKKEKKALASVYAGLKQLNLDQP